MACGRTLGVMTTARRTTLALAVASLAGAAVVLCVPAGAVADSVETTTTVTVRPGPLVLYGVPAARSFMPLVRRTAAGPSAVLPAIRVVDATGSGHGWHLAVSLVSGGGAWVRIAVSAYNGPSRMRPHSAGDVRLTSRPARSPTRSASRAWAPPSCAASWCSRAAPCWCASSWSGDREHETRAARARHRVTNAIGVRRSPWAPERGRRIAYARYLQ